MLGLAFTIIFGALAIHFGCLVREHGWRQGFRQWRNSNSPLGMAFGKAFAASVQGLANSPAGDNNLFKGDSVQDHYDMDAPYHPSERSVMTQAEVEAYNPSARRDATARDVR